VRPFVEVKLKTPVCDKDGRVLLETLKIVKPRMKEILRAHDAAKGKSEATLSVHLIALCSGVAVPLIEEIEPEDYADVGAAFETLQAKDPETGER
jgi:hypothetical protein